MKMINKVVIGATLALGLVAIVHAQQGPMGGNGPMGMMGQGPMSNGMGPGMMRGKMMQGQITGPNSPMKIMQQLMTPAERLAMMDKMADAKSWEERQAIMTTTHAEMEKRAKVKGITLPAGHGPQMMPGKNCG
ncbi:hypothetical protein [Polynucleobacter sp. MWH-UH35A]|uniref:hypothetical protein n=1 Tax=Polynucleobacter sp. MWH-UH35A TaxID=1855619 RepID=UPI001BFD8C2C|nr:hypothetical protein [Polynucleobacter sp. MWH-UH35A]QWD59786.1 hypothetical protein ICV36_08285 [Polynucleobacter sp. MWH-UH35A]